LRIFLTILLACDIVHASNTRIKDKADGIALLLSITLSVIGIVFVWRI